MSKMNSNELAEVFRLHQLWLKAEAEGVRANLRGADLRGANLQGADLQRANLREADLQGANLQWAYLQGANLQWADLRGADLRGANLRGANLYGTYLQGADLRGANLQWAYLQGADLQWANLRGADLRGANLQRANLREADLQGANLQWAYLQGANLQWAYLQGANLQGADLRWVALQGAKLPPFQICPEIGSFIAFKKLAGGVIATLEIPAEAKRTSSLVGRKCRAEFVKVLELSSGASEAVSTHDKSIVYRVGEVVRPDKYDDDIRIECTNGIHFFSTRKEAEEY